MKPDPEQIEFLLSQLPDGALAPRQRQSIEEALRGDPRWAAVAADYRRLADLLERLRTTDRAHSADDDVSAADLRAAVSAALSEQVEFQISQSLDGDLDSAEAEHLERTLRANPELAAQRTGYARLDGMLRAAARSQPTFNPDALRAAIRRDVVRAAAGAELTGASAAGRIGAGGRHVRTAGRRYGWLDGLGAAAVAAALLLAVFVWRPAHRPDQLAGRSAAPRSVVTAQVAAPASRGLVRIEIDTNLPEAGAVATGDAPLEHGIISGGAAQAADRPVIDTAAVALMF